MAASNSMPHPQVVLEVAAANNKRQAAKQPDAAAPPANAAAAGGDADKEYLDKMRGWLMTVATLFVAMPFQAMLHLPDWLKMEWLKKHGKAGSPLAAPAAPSPHTADATAGGSVRAALYLIFNVVTFGAALALVQALLWETTPSPRRTMTFVRRMMRVLTIKIGKDRSDWYVQVVWPVDVYVVDLARPTSLTGMTGPSRVRVLLKIFIDLDLVIKFLAGQVHPPYKYKGSRPIEPSNRSNTKYYYLFNFYCPSFF